jgi:aminomethyltransferase
VIIYRKSETDFFLVPNASNTHDVVRNLQSKAPDSVTIENLHEDYGVIALQGPLSASVLENLGVSCEMDYMAFSEITIAHMPAILCRTGYTGEYGFEIIPLRADVAAMWDLLAEQVLKSEGLVCGLGARDTLRTEMGYPLHGHELSLAISPVQASATWAIGWKKGAFQGSDALTAEKSVGPTRRLRALRSNDRGIPRPEMSVTDAAGSTIGVVTSGTFSPTLRVGIALALVDSSYSIGDEVAVDIRGRQSVATIVNLPFVPSRVRDK